MTAPNTRARWVEVTPEYAAKVLAQNYSGNRSVSKRIVDLYARQMAAGHWKPIPDGISLAEDGTLLNGQHRLHAVVKAGVPVRMLITWGVPTSAYSAFDNVRVRTMGQRITRPDLYVAVARAMIGGLSQETVRISSYDAEATTAFLDTHGQAITWVVERRPKGQKKRYFPAVVCGVIARAYYHADEGRLAEGMYLLAEGLPPTGEVVAAPELSVIRLRELMVRSGALAAGRRAEMYAKASRAFRAFVDGQPLQALYASSVELFPLPEESAKKGGAR